MPDKKIPTAKTIIEMRENFSLFMILSPSMLQFPVIIYFQGPANTMQPGAVSEYLETLTAALPETVRESGLIGISIFRHGTLAEDHLVLLSSHS